MDYKKFSNELVTFLDMYRDQSMKTDDDYIYACYAQDCGILVCIIGMLIFAKDHTLGCPGRYLTDDKGNEININDACKLYEQDLQDLIERFQDLYERRSKGDPCPDKDQLMDELRDILFDLWN